MTCPPRALLAAAFVCAAFFLQGCGVPSFVASQCEAMLEPLLGQASLNAFPTVMSKCRAQYKAVKEENLCVLQSQSTIDLAKTRVFPKYLKQCSDYVVESACKEGSDCYKAHNKITVSQAAAALVVYVQHNSAAVVAAMNKDLGSKIDDVISAKYQTKFATRAVPLAIQEQCLSLIQQRLGGYDAATGSANIQEKPNAALTKACSGTERSADWVQKCQDNGVTKMFSTKESRENEFKTACAKAALAQECPTGSKCAIDTKNADLSQTLLFAKSYVFLHYDQWFSDLKAALMKDATEASGRLLSQPPTSRLFGMLELPTAHVKTGLLVWTGVGSLVAGAGLLLVVVAAVRVVRKRLTRSVHIQSDVTEAELLVAA